MAVKISLIVLAAAAALIAIGLASNSAQLLVASTSLFVLSAAAASALAAGRLARKAYKALAPADIHRK